MHPRIFPYSFTRPVKTDPSCADVKMASKSNRERSITDDKLVIGDNLIVNHASLVVPNARNV